MFCVVRRLESGGRTKAAVWNKLRSGAATVFGLPAVLTAVGAPPLDNDNID